MTHVRTQGCQSGVHQVASLGLAGSDYPTVTGIRPATVVPPPGAERTSNEPPSTDRRSAIFWMPEPMAVVEES